MLPRRGYLGAELPADADAFVDGGMVIAGVVAGGMAEQAGLRAGDRVMAIGNVRTRDLCALGEALRRAGARATVMVEIDRAGMRLVFETNVIEAPRDERVVYGELSRDTGRGIAARDLSRGMAARDLSRGMAARDLSRDRAASGAILRTLETAGARAVIVLVGGIACESVEAGPFELLAHAWTRAGYATVRFDKRGVGDSEGGPCRDVDFATELEDARAVVGAARRGGLPVIAFGHSVGGIIATQLAASAATQLGADALIVYGTPVMRWLDCLRDSTRRQMTLRGAPPAAIEAQVRALDELLVRGELNGRSAAYHAQLHALDLEAAWRAVEVPVLVVRGEHDWVVAADDQARIAQLARNARIVDVPRLDHVLGAHADRDASVRDYGAGTPDDAVALATIAWLDSLDLAR